MMNYPIQAVLDGTITTRIGDVADNLIFIGMLTQELSNRGEAVMAIEQFRTSREYTAWLVSADNYLKYLLDNYTAEITVVMASVLIRDRKMPFAPDRMQSFDGFSALSARMMMA